ncbi:MAG: hypothetical protein ABI171_06140 [Collimonas sp.]|uniref:hypothetical protein n=1 Tax=Collimonas sp. TaxID=1963772 RepID=UPI0032650FDF
MTIAIGQFDIAKVIFTPARFTYLYAIDMELVPTQKTAALAGIWAAFGFVPVEHWMDQSHMSTLHHNVLMLFMMLAFLFVPALYLVIGRDNRFSRTWLMDPEERARYWIVCKRMLCWLLGAALFGTIWSRILNFFW